MRRVASRCSRRRTPSWRSPSAISSRGGGTVEPQLWRAGIRSVVSPRSQPPERQASKVTATTIPIKIRRFATKSCSRIGLAWRLAPAEMDHPDGDNSRDPALDEDGHRAHRDDVDCDHDHDADDQPRRRYGLTPDCQFRGTGQSTGAARAELSEEARRG